MTSVYVSLFLSRRTTSGGMRSEVEFLELLPVGWSSTKRAFCLNERPPNNIVLLPKIAVDIMCAVIRLRCIDDVLISIERAALAGSSRNVGQWNNTKQSLRHL